MISLLFATYAAVFVAEIVGDKLLYTTGILATRYRPWPIVCGITFAFMLKMAAAVLIGQAISELPSALVAGLTTVSFAGVAYTLWRKPDAPLKSSREHTTSRAAMVSFASVFFSEWGDIGQITAATMAARFAAPVPVWTGAVLAMVTKGMLAAAAGAGIRQAIRERISPRVVRLGGVVLMLTLAALSVAETMSRH